MMETFLNLHVFLAFTVIEILPNGFLGITVLEILPNTHVFLAFTVLETLPNAHVLLPFTVLETLLNAHVFLAFTVLETLLNAHLFFVFIRQVYDHQELAYFLKQGKIMKYHKKCGISVPFHCHFLHRKPPIFPGESPEVKYGLRHALMLTLAE